MNTKLTKQQEEYNERVKKASPKSRTFFQCVRAFVTGGIICCIGQLTGDLSAKLFSLDVSESASVTSMFMIFLGALLTGLGVYDKIGAWAGAGSVVPITGFANAIVSPAMEFKREGFIMGVGANMFKIAGPVIVYGTVASVIYGIIYWIVTLL